MPRPVTSQPKQAAQAPSDAEMLRALIDRVGLSARRFAREVLAGRDERTVRRWLAGDTMPDQVREWLQCLDKVTEEMGGLTIRLRWGKPR